LSATEDVRSSQAALETREDAGMQQPITQPVDRPHCLGPTFTAKLAKILERGRSVNLIGAPGQGCSRLLEDLPGTADGDTLWLQVNMKGCRGSFGGFLASYGNRAAWRETAPATSAC